MTGNDASNDTSNDHDHNPIDDSSANRPTNNSSSNGKNRSSNDPVTTKIADPPNNNHPGETHHSSDGDRSQQSQSSLSFDRRSSLRGSAKRRGNYSPRWRDQERTPEGGICAHRPSSEPLSGELRHCGDERNDSASPPTPNDGEEIRSRQFREERRGSSNRPTQDGEAAREFDESENNRGRSSTPSHDNLSITHPMIHSETRFPTASYAASEAAKSDIATVCSGSVIEDIDKDIDMASVHSADFAHSASREGVSASSSLVERAFVLKKSSLGGTMHHIKHERGVEFASHTHTYPFHRNAPSHPSSEEVSRGTLAEEMMTTEEGECLNDMGPPLSRTLLLAATAAASGETSDHRHHHRDAEGPNSRAGSVRSFNSVEAPSDVVAHVDTDDCGGSMSEVSQEDHKERNSLDIRLGTNAGTVEPQNLGDAQNSIVNTSTGRVSPGGTIYKGRGVRRYQGRYMKLPLKRFHQGEFNETVAQNPLQEGEDLYYNGDDSDNDVPAQPPQWDDWSNSGYRSLSRSFSRSISPPPSRSRSRSRSESPRDNLRRRRPSWSPHRNRGSDRRRPIKSVERSPSRSPSPKGREDGEWSRSNSDRNRRPIKRSVSPPKDKVDDNDNGRWRRRHSPSNGIEMEGNDGRWRRDRWNNDRRSRSRSRSRSRNSPRRSPRRGRKRKGSRSRS